MRVIRSQASGGNQNYEAPHPHHNARASLHNRTGQPGTDRDRPGTGGNARAGLEDTLYLRKGELSAGNLPLVERAVSLAAGLDRPVASVEEAAALLRPQPR
jgi:hypothetical protein